MNFVKYVTKLFQSLFDISSRMRWFFRSLLLVVFFSLFFWGVVYAFPDTSVIDDFNRADGSIGSSYSCDVQYNIVSNVLVAPSGSDHYCVYNVTAYGANQQVYYTLSGLTSSSSFGMFVKKQELSGSINGIFVIYRPSSGLFETYIEENNVEYSQGTVSGSLAVGDVFGVGVVGNVLTVYVNGGVVGTWDVSSFDYINQGGYIAIRTSNDSSLSIDNFGGGSYALPTDTPTFTPTFTPSLTFTPSPTLTFTPSPTFTFTSSPTFTFTPSPTFTFTPSVTPTSTPLFYIDPNLGEFISFGDGGLYFRLFVGLIFLFMGLYWQGLFFFMIYPYIMKQGGEWSYPLVSIVIVVLFISQFLFRLNSVFSKENLK